MDRVMTNSDWNDTAVLAETTYVRPLQIKQLLCDGDAQAAGAFATYLSRLLNASLTQIRLEGAGKAQVAQARRAAGDADLVILDEPERTLPQRLLALCSSTGFVRQVEKSILVARAPRWPLHRILLVLRAHGSDETAVAWTARLAAAAGAEVTALAVVPPVPALYAGGNPRVGLNELLAPNTTSGARLRHSLHQLAHSRVNAVLHMRQGEPDWQIRQEMAEGRHDLVILGAEKNGRWQRWLLGELVAPLLRWSPRPVLIAKERKGKTDERFSRN